MKYLFSSKDKSIIYDNLKYNDIDLRFWDVPGKESFRSMWSNYLEEIEGLIFIIDVNKENIENSLKILSN